MFGQDHVAKVLFDWNMEGASHDAVVDAIKSIRLFNYYHSMQANPPEWEEAKVNTPRLLLHSSDILHSDGCLKGS